MIAHSQGGSIFLEALSMGLLRGQIRQLVCLAPVTQLHHQGSELLSLMGTFHVDSILKSLGNIAFSPTPSLLGKLLGPLCKFHSKLCLDISSSLFGTPVPANVNSSNVGTYANHWPDQTSTQNMEHWIQSARTGNFATFGGELIPVGNIKVNTTFFVGGRDYLGDVVDAQNCFSQIIPQNGIFLVESFAHMDFTWSYKANTLVYKYVLPLLR